MLYVFVLHFQCNVLTNVLKLRFWLVFGLVFGLVYGPVQGLNYDWLGFIVACISQVFKGSIASLKCSCFLGDKTPQPVCISNGNQKGFHAPMLSLPFSYAEKTPRLMSKLSYRLMHTATLIPWQSI